MTLVVRNRFGNEIETTPEIAHAMVSRGEAEIVSDTETPVTSRKNAKREKNVVVETPVTETE